MFGAQHLHHPIPHFCAVLRRLQHAPHISLGKPLNFRLQIPLEHHAMVRIRPVLFCLLPAGGNELLGTSAHLLLHQYLVSPRVPGVKPLLDPPPDCVGCGDMVGLL